MPFKKIGLILIIGLLFTLSLTQRVWAGFGISPPYLTNENLTRGSHYEKKIVFVRGDPVEDWQAEITIDLPKAAKWISIDKGTKFILPKGEKQVPIIVSVDVPNKANFGRYKGSLKVKTGSLKAPQGGMVAIALGGQIDIDLNVVKAEIFDFLVRGIKIFDTEEGYQAWWGYVPGKIKFSMQIENKGNIKAAPTKVYFDIYDNTKKQILESTQTTKIGKVKPFEIKWVSAELPTKLKAGSYWVQYKIFEKNQIAQQGEIHLSVLPYGTISGSRGLKFADLPNWFKITSGLIILAILIGLGLLILKKKKS